MHQGDSPVVCLHVFADDVDAQTPVQVQGQQLSLVESIKHLEQQRAAAPPID